MKIGIITIHKINNYGSVLQAYALQKMCDVLGHSTEIIDYLFPNQVHMSNKYAQKGIRSNEPRWIKILFSLDLYRQHQTISKFVRKYQHLSKKQYNSPDDLLLDTPSYDIYITGSDQLWNPRHCNGDPAFLLHFAPDVARKISYAASISTKQLPHDLLPLYKKLLNRYDYISVRERSGADIIKNLIHKDVDVVLDPTLLLNRDQWNSIATPKRLYRKKYILCYFLNYSFDSFPYVDNLAQYIQKQTGYEIIRVARPPHHLGIPHTHYRVGASPEDFLALIRDSEMVLTTSFHGTAFAINFGKPLFTIVQNHKENDSRQVNLMQSLGLESQILSIEDEMPDTCRFTYNTSDVQKKLEQLRKASIQFLENSIIGQNDSIMQ